jgi:glycogen debranching enzyme
MFERAKGSKISLQMVSALRDIARLVPENGQGFFGSAGELYGDAIFGRDSVEAGEHLVHLKPAIARGVILELSRLQGVRDAPIGPGSNEEERGKVHHEHRSLHMESRRISHRQELILRELGARWGGEGDSLTYYGAVDATPLFVRLVHRHVKAHGPGILAETVVGRDGAPATVEEKMLAAVEWITRRIDSSDLGMIECLRRNPDGISFQYWKDSGTSYIHRDSTIADWDQPTAAVEVQAYAVDALLGVADLFEDRMPGAAEVWRERAAALRDRVLETMWMPREKYFAMGLDRDREGRPHWIDSIASNAALTLDTALFDGLPDADRYVTGIARRICGPGFLTEAGLRCRTVEEDSLTDFQDYHGVWAVWMREALDVIKGLHRQGMPEAARALGVRTVNAVNVAGDDVEFLYVSPHGRVMYDYKALQESDPLAEEILGTNYPEEGQGWTAVASLVIKHWFGSGHWPIPAGGPSHRPRSALDAELVAAMPPCELLGNRVEIAAAFERRGRFLLNPEVGLERDLAARARRRGRA